MSNDNGVIAKEIPKLYNIPPPDGDGHGAPVEQVRGLCPFCLMLLDLPEILHLAVLDLAQALATSL